MDASHLYLNLVFFIFSWIAAVASRCINVRECPAATKYLEDFRNNAIDNSSIQVLRRALCEISDSQITIYCEKVPPCYQPKDKNFCIKARDCCVAVRLVRMKINYSSEIKSLIKKSTCAPDGPEVKVKCGSLLEVEELLLKNGGNDACVTPNGLKGRCIPYKSCHVYDGKPVTPNYLQHLKSAVCDGGNEKVCCAKDEDFQYPCGFNPDETDKISGGTVTVKNEFPWIVKLIYSDPQVVCGGTLINSQFVVTAAHCVGNQNLTEVRLGGNVASVDIPVIDKRYHENFRRRPMDNDVALVKIQKVQFQDNIKWICLPPKGANLADKFVIVGNGVTEKGALSQSQLLKATLPNLDRSRCENIFKHFIENYDLIICAGGEPGVDSCRGDSGGPLMSKNSDLTWFLDGIVSGGITDCTQGSPGFYTRVDRYLNWIKGNMLQMI